MCSGAGCTSGAVFRCRQAHARALARRACSHLQQHPPEPPFQKADLHLDMFSSLTDLAPQNWTLPIFVESMSDTVSLALLTGVRGPHLGRSLVDTLCCHAVMRCTHTPCSRLMIFFLVGPHLQPTVRGTSEFWGKLEQPWWRPCCLRRLRLSQPCCATRSHTR
jgi:hypothetical protein